MSWIFGFPPSSSISCNFQVYPHQFVKNERTYMSGFTKDDALSLQILAGDCDLDLPPYPHQLVDERLEARQFAKNCVAFQPLAHGNILPGSITGMFYILDVPVFTFVIQKNGSAVMCDIYKDAHFPIDKIQFLDVTGELLVYWDLELCFLPMCHLTVSYEYDWVAENSSYV